MSNADVEITVTSIDEPPRASIIITTCGDREWVNMATERALPSALAQEVEGVEIIVHHDDYALLHQARNDAAAKASGEWLCFLDADDELEPGYVEAMLAGNCDLRYPMVRYIDQGQPEPDAVALAKKNLLLGNYMVIGTFVRKSMFNKVGGFDEWESWEDWAFWIKCWLAGGQSNLVPGAVYRVHRSSSGRCWCMADAQKLFDQISGFYRPIAKERNLI